jgi:hypothetical protein
MTVTLTDRDRRDEQLALNRSTMTTTRSPDAITAATWATYRRAVRRDLGADVYELAAERLSIGKAVVTFPARAVLGLED